MTTRSGPTDRHGEVLIAIMNNEPDFAILKEELWYRIPVSSTPAAWPPDWLAFYQTKVFGAAAYSVRYFGRVVHKQIVERRDLFPHQLPSPKSERRYWKISLRSLECLPQPILSPRPRRNPFIPTTWSKFREAGEINDLFDESPLENSLWDEFKVRRIPAERQWEVKVHDQRYYLDFAVFCTDGSIDIETDGDTWHADSKRIPQDNRRNNDIESAGWHVLRFNGLQIRERLLNMSSWGMIGAWP